MIETLKPKNQGTKKIFKNQILEHLTRTHILVPISLFIVYSTLLLYWSFAHTTNSIWTSVALFILGWLFFTWIEYIVHRYIFHMSPTSVLRKKIQYTMHGVHHEYPKDKDRLAMPPILSITLATLLFFIFRFLINNFVYTFLPGILIGYAAYLAVHYMVHAFPPSQKFLRTLWTHHAIHHYKSGDSVYGVSSPLWDYIYGTIPSSHSSSQSCKK